MNILLLLIPLAWVSRFLEWSHTATFTRNVILPPNNEVVSTHRPYSVSFFAIIPLERLFDYGGEQMSHYLGKDLGGLLIITLNKSISSNLNLQSESILNVSFDLVQ